MMTAVATPPTIGRLRIERQLGAGGFATVWLAHDPELDSPVAVKILAENLAAQSDIRRRFADEARLLRRVDSDHLVRVYDVGELPDGRPFFVMTYADRGNLAERMAHLPPPWPAPSVSAVVDALADALDVLHRHGVIHRDIKPRNVLLRGTPDGGERVLLGDLGIAKDLQWASGITVPTGSSGYAAPEQGGFSERIGPPTDVHALAMTAAELLGVRPPWTPTPLGAALARATDPDPGRRTPTAPAFAAQFRAALVVPAQASTPVLTPPPIPLPPPGATQVVTPYSPVGGFPAPARRPQRRWLLPVAMTTAVLLIALTTWAGWALSHRRQRVTPVDGKVSIEVPAGWRARSDVAFPGEDDPHDGVRMRSGKRSVTVALSDDFEEPRALLERVRPTGCVPGRTWEGQVGSWTHLTERFTACLDGVDVSEVALARDGAPEWTVWVEVRSENGDPDLATVLKSLEITP